MEVFTMDDVVAIMAISYECSEATARAIVRCSMLEAMSFQLPDRAPQREKDKWDAMQRRFTKILL
jgi:hypothetical protein